MPTVHASELRAKRARAASAHSRQVHVRQDLRFLDTTADDHPSQSGSTLETLRSAQPMGREEVAGVGRGAGSAEQPSRGPNAGPPRHANRRVRWVADDC